MAKMLSGEDVDQRFRARGAFTLVNLRGTYMICYRFNKSLNKQVFYPGPATPTMDLLREFLVKQAVAKA